MWLQTYHEDMGRYILCEQRAARIRNTRLHTYWVYLCMAALWEKISQCGMYHLLRHAARVNTYLKT